MINREKQTVSVVSFTPGKDAYGQKRTLGSISRKAEMFLKIYHQTNIGDIRYVDVEMIGLTEDKDITDSNQIQFGDETYQVLFTIPSRRYNQVLMKRV